MQSYFFFFSFSFIICVSTVKKLSQEVVNTEAKTNLAEFWCP